MVSLCTVMLFLWSNIMDFQTNLILNLHDRRQYYTNSRVAPIQLSLSHYQFQYLNSGIFANTNYQSVTSVRFFPNLKSVYLHATWWYLFIQGDMRPGNDVAFKVSWLNEFIHYSDKLDGNLYFNWVIAVTTTQDSSS